MRAVLSFSVPDPVRCTPAVLTDREPIVIKVILRRFRHKLLIDIVIITEEVPSIYRI